ncbi:MAG TPA: tetratricopeptide repeat protein [Candidatus Binatia bacterium]|nr:tetratricopeptide repeat protein [Candidatus Binatia bacterium]
MQTIRIILAAAFVFGASAAFAAVNTAAFAADDTVTPDNAANPDFSSVKSLVDSGKYADAMPQLMALDKASPNNPDILNLIGFSLRKTGHADEALDYYNRALSLQPNHLGANEYLGELYLEMKQPAKAEERLAVLQKACGDCEEYQELKEKIAQTAAN